MARLPVRSLLIVVGMLMAGSASRAWGQLGPSQGGPEFSASVGYSNISLNSAAVDDQSALHFDSSLSIGPIRVVPQLRIGVDVGASLVLDNSVRTISTGSGGLVITGSSSVPLWLLEPELRLSWRQCFGKDQNIFIEPGICGGGAFGFLNLNSSTGALVQRQFNDRIWKGLSARRRAGGHGSVRDRGLVPGRRAHGFWRWSGGGFAGILHRDFWGGEAVTSLLAQMGKMNDEIQMTNR